MISGFSGKSNNDGYIHAKPTVASNLPVPFNIAIVLHNLLFEDIDLELDNKQADLKESLVFSHKALAKMNERYAKKEQELRRKIFEEPDNLAHKDALEEMSMDRLEGYNHFKDLVSAMADMLNKQQYAKLLEFSNIAL